MALPTAIGMKKGAARYAKASLNAALINRAVVVGLKEDEDEVCFEGLKDDTTFDAMEEMADDAGENRDEDDPNNW